MSQKATRGPGYERMMARLGKEKAEELRQQVLKEQTERLGEAKEVAEGLRNRETYSDYPPPQPKPKSKRRK